jgi:hypothetical protein
MIGVVVRADDNISAKPVHVLPKLVGECLTRVTAINED